MSNILASSESSISPTKRFKVTPFTLSSAAKFHALHPPPTKSSSPSRAVPPRASKGESKHNSLTVTTISNSKLKPSPNTTPTSHSWPSSTLITASAKILPKLGRRARGVSLWDALICLAFASASVVFFSAIAGVGRVPDEPEPVRGWRAPTLGVVEHDRPSQISVPGLFEKFLRLSGFRRTGVVMESGGIQLEAEIASDPISKDTCHHAHGCPHLGAWHKPHRSLQHVREPRIYHTPTDWERRFRRRSSWMERPPPSPYHNSFHNRLSKRDETPGMSPPQSDSEQHGGEEALWSKDEDHPARVIESKESCGEARRDCPAEAGNS